MLKTEDLIFNRGDDGNLIAQEITLEMEGGPVVRVKPLTRGKLQEIYAKAKSSNEQEKLESDNEIIRQGLVEPTLTEEQLKDLKPNYATAISIGILAVSLGITQKEVQEKAEKMIHEQEDELKKN